MRRTTRVSSWGPLRSRSSCGWTHVAPGAPHDWPPVEEAQATPETNKRARTNMTIDARRMAHFVRRRQLLQGSAAALPALSAPLRGQGTSKPLQVGGLPVTCNLTLPVACAASSADNGAQRKGALFEFSKYSGWPAIKKSLMTGRIKAAYMLAPLIIALADSR